MRISDWSSDVCSSDLYLTEVYLPRHNAQFAVAPEMEASAFVAIPGFDIDNILCVQEDRQVGADNTVRYMGMILQIPYSHFRHHFDKLRDRQTFVYGKSAVSTCSARWSQYQ